MSSKYVNAPQPRLTPFSLTSEYFLWLSFCPNSTKQQPHSNYNSTSVIISLRPYRQPFQDYYANVIIGKPLFLPQNSSDGVSKKVKTNNFNAHDEIWESLRKALNLARQIIQGNLRCKLYKKNCHFHNSCVCFQFLNRDCAKAEQTRLSILSRGLILIISFMPHLSQRAEMLNKMQKKFLFPWTRSRIWWIISYSAIWKGFSTAFY